MKLTVLLIVFVVLVGCGKKETVDEKSEVTIEKDVVKEEIDTISIIPSSYPFRYDSILTDKKNDDFWRIYKRVRAEAKELGQNGEYLKANDSLLLAAECMVKVKEYGIASWQFNNAGKNCIDLFMRETDYQKEVSLLSNMKPGVEKREKIKEVQGKYTKHMASLDWGKLYLYKAYDCNEDDFDKKREKSIKNNLAFIEEVEKFMKI